MAVKQEIIDQYELIVGLEVHAQLLTKSKAFSSDRNEYGNLPNTNTSAISLGHPGTLPVLNERSAEYAVRLGLACKAQIREHNEFARKNYFYADLPKGYQITQDTTPICNGGFIAIKTAEFGDKKVGLTRIHMEEDSGKSIHDISPFDTMIDLNRAGVPLLEIVSEPDMRSADEAYAYLTEVRKLVRYLDICDGNMEEGSMRCDANVSIRKKGAEVFGTRVEIKNLNSIRNVKRAIEFEFLRHIDVIESGGEIRKATLTFNATTGETSEMRTKEEADDYRYFPEPDLQPLTITQDYIEKIKAELPPLPSELFEKYTGNFGLSEYEANVLTDDKDFALYFEEVVKSAKSAKSAANWMMGEVKGHINELAIDITKFALKPAHIAELANLVEEGKMGRTLASQQLFPLMLSSPDKAPAALAAEHDLVQVEDVSELEVWIEQAVAKFPDKVEEYRSGKKGILGLFMGEVMRLSKGKADPKITNQMIIKALENNA
ncbi:MAG: Asp-tRNA(Asn)/Glu-tRNA(Gln) amidotransferase subunit GatB [Salibacteraceae bacterium]|jgi:aspartyl-tRNA(Asn)/glutamyl-tRNA(Gln) amidotransferase subunit B|nr:Asp-tRNA(Asn)/Glu-tRNA(Gln) amidotransferase subunit GatB [Salibacteraceae bacterium]MDP4965364.1 Asp-tRNA(Asn)/Glu-tRNA(Gln) amidotransferase subunit GatB [Salibacteraceae bacterium]